MKNAHFWVQLVRKGCLPWPVARIQLLGHLAYKCWRRAYPPPSSPPDHPPRWESSLLGLEGGRWQTPFVGVALETLTRSGHQLDLGRVALTAPVPQVGLAAPRQLELAGPDVAQQ